MKRGRNTISPSIIGNLAKMQDALNCFIDKDWRVKRKADDWGLAVTIESTELIDSYPWKWWKNVNATPDFKNVKIELVDILHFSLSGNMQVDGQKLAAIPEDVDRSITSPLSETQNAIRTFRHVIYLAKVHHFETITEMVIEAAEDLDFNMVAYYIAKHTLNYIRQLGGYKDGSYVKVNKGTEDNELLHACIAPVTVGQALDEATHAQCWDAIMASVYDAFTVAAKDRRTVTMWCSVASA